MTTTRLQPAHKTLTVNGLGIQYLEWGAANALPVICVHGYTSSAEAFNALARRLQHRMRIIAPHVRGHGESDWSPEGAYGFLDQMSDVAALVDRLELEQFAVIGTSMGGIIAMAYAAAHPRRLKSLVINDIGPDVEDRSQRITQTVGARPEDDQRELALGVLREAGDGRWVWKMDPAYIEQRAARGAPVRPDLWPALRALPCPTLVIWGTTSDVLGEQQARQMANTLPHGELVSVAGIGHAPALVEPPVLEALEQLL
jgi:esterase